MIQYPIKADDPLAAEHRAVAEWVEDSAAVRDEGGAQAINLNSQASGKRLLSGSPDQLRRNALAAMEQARFWQASFKCEKEEWDRLTGEQRAERWRQRWKRKQSSKDAVQQLLRLSLPWQMADLCGFVAWCNEQSFLEQNSLPLVEVIRAVESYALTQPLNEALRYELLQLERNLTRVEGDAARILRVAVSSLCGVEAKTHEKTLAVAMLEPPTPRPAGHPQVMRDLKAWLGIIPASEQQDGAFVGMDNYWLAADSPFRQEHQILTELVEEIGLNERSNVIDFGDFKSGRQIALCDPAQRGPIFMAIAERHVQAFLNRPTTQEQWQGQLTIDSAACAMQLFRAEHFELSRDFLFDLLLYCSIRPPGMLSFSRKVQSDLLERLRESFAASPLTAGERYVLWRARQTMAFTPLLGAQPAEIGAVNELLGDDAIFCLGAGEHWSDQVNAEFRSWTPKERQQWLALFAHALTAATEEPSDKWMEKGAQLVQAIKSEVVQQALERWLPRVPEGRTTPILGERIFSGMDEDEVLPDNTTILRGLFWLFPVLPRPRDLISAISAMDPDSPDRSAPRFSEN